MVLSIIGIIGGTGKLGAALGGRWSKAGHTVLIGSRDTGNAGEVARELSSRFAGKVEGRTNLDAAREADIVVSTVPFAAQEERLKEITEAVQGKLFIDTTVPLMPPKVMRVQLPAVGSAVQQALALLGPGVRLASAFHSVAAHKLALDHPIACDILVFSDEKAARDEVITLVQDAGLRGLHGGALANSAAAEALTSVLIFINKTYQVDGAGIQITGELILPSSP
jgi:NADPH-dependent F420 reductase